jgi:hypothetical protein
MCKLGKNQKIKYCKSQREISHQDHKEKTMKRKRKRKADQRRKEKNTYI